MLFIKIAEKARSIVSSRTSTLLSSLEASSPEQACTLGVPEDVVNYFSGPIESLGVPPLYPSTKFRAGEFFVAASALQVESHPSLHVPIGDLTRDFGDHGCRLEGMNSLTKATPFF
ncbi:hypothetical protein [Streptomyces calidiresistens]|uniref:Uncharacterized protein n=1 Tax=Streptomyces calidiresistens TaxID=1485586 RepID=A0A7W3XUS9_9ACTN|nr:hypothetical protein [Streptomyces calidiresistens]MBB0228245.1 hypothetical protein [Streptomyces calidiresistens]